MKHSHTLIEKAVTNDIAGVRALLDTGIHPHELIDKTGVTALHHAAQHDFIEMAGLLLRYGADPPL